MSFSHRIITGIDESVVIEPESYFCMLQIPHQVRTGSGFDVQQNYRLAHSQTAGSMWFAPPPPQTISSHHGINLGSISPTYLVQ